MDELLKLQISRNTIMKLLLTFNICDKDLPNAGILLDMATSRIVGTDGVAAVYNFITEKAPRIYFLPLGEKEKFEGLLDADKELQIFSFEEIDATPESIKIKIVGSIEVDFTFLPEGGLFPKLDQLVPKLDCIKPIIINMNTMLKVLRSTGITPDGLVKLYVHNGNPKIPMALYPTTQSFAFFVQGAKVGQSQSDVQPPKAVIVDKEVIREKIIPDKRPNPLKYAREASNEARSETDKKIKMKSKKKTR